MTPTSDKGPLTAGQRAQLAQTDDREPDVEDIPEAPANSVRHARRGLTAPRTLVRLQLDLDVLTWLEDRGTADQSHINDILRERMMADRDRHNSNEVEA